VPQDEEGLQGTAARIIYIQTVRPGFSVLAAPILDQGVQQASILSANGATHCKRFLNEQLAYCSDVRATGVCLNKMQTYVPRAHERQW